MLLLKHSPLSNAPISQVFNSISSTTRHKGLHSSEISYFIGLGILKHLQVGVLRGNNSFTATLGLSHVGYSAVHNENKNYILSQENYTLNCFGPHSLFYLTRISEGSLVHLVARAILRPRYVPIHSAYIYETELQITDTFGHLTVLQRYPNRISITKDCPKSSQA